MSGDEWPGRREDGQEPMRARPDPAMRELCRKIAEEGDPKQGDGWVADIFWCGLDFEG